MMFTVQENPEPCAYGKEDTDSMRARLLLAFVLAISISGCVSTRPDLKRLYEHQNEDRFYNPVIIMHGFAGSRLRNKYSKRELWPPGLPEVLSLETYELALHIDPDTLASDSFDIEAYALFAEYGAVDFYRGLIKTLSQPGGYKAGKPGTPVKASERRYYTFVYDWRDDIVNSARKLDSLISQIRRDYGMPELKVDIVAHSLGGLVTRYYARYGTRDVLVGDNFDITNVGAKRIHKAVLMGTPNLGSVAMVYTYITGLGVGPLGLPPEVLTTMPAVFQLFPHPMIPWLLDINGKTVNASLYDVETWQHYRWGIYDPHVAARVLEMAPDPEQGKLRLDLLRRYFARQLERSRRLSWALSARNEHTPLRYIMFGGDCELTPARILVEKELGKYLAHVFPDRIVNPKPGIDYSRIMLQPGDRRVTKPSLLSRESLDPTVVRHHRISAPIQYSIMFCVKHDNLTGNIHFQDNLLNILLTAD
jgi:pimeloyl-ACP methyl ester carboxylesterase